MANYGYLQITRQCNQKCRFCSNPPTEKELTLSNAKAIIDKHISQGCAGIIFTGGEPTLFKEIAELVLYCSGKKIDCKIITNAQKLADNKFLEKLIKAGLKQFHISFYSHKSKTQNFLSGNNDSFKNLKLALNNLSKRKDVSVAINTVINKYNAGHLYKNAEWLLGNFPFINHFVWNNLDPASDQAGKHQDTIPRLNDFELELKQAADFLIKSNKSLRVERVPLCYMPGFEHFSTETRKIVKSESRNIYFLDDKKNYFVEEKWGYGKAECCQVCKLHRICAGLYEMDKHYDSKELYPVFIEPQSIIDKIINSGD